MKNKTPYKTLNSMGYMVAQPDEYQQAFIDNASSAKKPILDIGAAYGVTTIPALKNGAYVIANDIEMKHLRILRKKVPPECLHQLTLKPGKVPGGVSFLDGSLSSVLAARSLHFLPGNELDRAIAQIYGWLEPGGKFFFAAITPYVKVLEPFMSVFLQHKREGKKWPGEIDNVHDYFPDNLKRESPNFVNVMDMEILEGLLVKHGFSIEKISYFKISGTLPEFSLDGRESIGAIAQKPC